MKCHVQKRFQSDVYVNCKPVHRSKCVPVNNFEISKECLSKIKNKNSFPIIQQKCNKLMNDLCFKTQKEFDKAKQEFVEFPDNMYICNIFYEYHKTIQDNPLHLSEKAFKEYFNEIFTKLLTSEVNNRFICSSGQLSDLYQGILLAISQTVIIQTHGNLIFKSHYCDVINNSQTFEKILTAVRLTFST